MGMVFSFGDYLSKAAPSSFLTCSFLLGFLLLLFSFPNHRGTRHVIRAIDSRHASFLFHGEAPVITKTDPVFMEHLLFRHPQELIMALGGSGGEAIRVK